MNSQATSPSEPGHFNRLPLPRGVWVFLIALYAICLCACVLTRDFGYCNDDKIHIGALRATFESGVPLPRTYHYPSFGYLVSLLASLPSWAAHGFDRGAFAAELDAALAAGLLPPPRVLLDARMAFCALSYLALFWTGLLAWRLSASRLATGAAALTLALSFELHYHSRILAPDALMAQFVLLSVLCAQRYASSARGRDLLCAAIAAGLAAGTKFPGALALTAVGVAALAIEFGGPAAVNRARSFWRSVRSCALALAVLLVVFLLTTPGVLFDFELVQKDIAIELRHYRGEGSAGSHAPYAVHAGWDHLQRLAVYVAGQGLSHSMPVALLLFALGAFGAVQLARRDRLGAALLFAVPTVYVSYFVYQRLMVVRNFEVLLPFLAIAVGLGLRELGAMRGARSFKLAALLAVALAFGWNTIFLLRADASILHRKNLDTAAGLRSFVESSDETVFLAPHARELVKAGRLQAGSARKLVLDPHDARWVLVVPGDLADLLASPGFSKLDLRANWPGIYEPLPQGPWEVNFSYYPTWRGDPRALRITSEYYCALAGLN